MVSKGVWCGSVTVFTNVILMEVWSQSEMGFQGKSADRETALVGPKTSDESPNLGKGSGKW